MNSERNRRILVVDDNRSIHEDFRKILCGSQMPNEILEDEQILFEGELDTVSQLDFQVDSAYQGEQGLEKVIKARQEEKPYAMAFVDMRMPPGWDGLETIDRIWKVDPHVEMVICTAYSDYSWNEIAAKLGDNPSKLLILKKPFDNAEVAQLAMSLSSKWTMARQADAQFEFMERCIAERTAEIERAYRESDLLLTAISSLLIGVNRDGMIYRWNSGAEQVLGIQAKDALGEPIEGLGVDWKDRATAENFLRSYRSRDVVTQVVTFNRNDSVRILNLSSNPVMSNSEHQGTLILGSDITEQSQLQEQLQQARKLESVGQLAAGVAHEINTPMQYVGDNLDFLQNQVKRLKCSLDKLLDRKLGSVEEGSAEHVSDVLAAELGERFMDEFFGETLEAITDSMSGVSHVSRIVRAMKEFAHPGEDQKSLVDINRALGSTIAISTNEWKYVAQIDTRLDPSLPLVPALGGELNQVFLNIIVNAAHAIEEAAKKQRIDKGTIRITTRGYEKYVEVSFSDTGVGMPRELIQRIYDPFFTTKDVGKGTGQGLAIAYSVIVQKHGGKLECDSEPGSGTTFTIQLPLESSEATHPNDELNVVGV